MTSFLDAPTRALPDWFGTDWTPPAPDVYVDYTRVSPWPRAPIPDWPQWVLRMYPAGLPDEVRDETPASDAQMRYLAYIGIFGRYCTSGEASLLITRFKAAQRNAERDAARAAKRAEHAARKAARTAAGSTRHVAGTP